MKNDDQVTVDRLWTVKDVRPCFATGRSWVYLAQSGRLPCLKVGGLLRFDPDAVRALAKGDVQPRVFDALPPDVVIMARLQHEPADSDVVGPGDQVPGIGGRISDLSGGRL